MGVKQYNWWKWVGGLAAAIIVMAAWFFWFEIPALTDDVPNNTLSGQFTQFTCVGPDIECQTEPWIAYTGAAVVGVLILAGISLLTWLFFHFYIEPFVTNKRNQDGKYDRR